MKQIFSIRLETELITELEKMRDEWGEVFFYKPTKTQIIEEALSAHLDRMKMEIKIKKENIAPLY